MHPHKGNSATPTPSHQPVRPPYTGTTRIKRTTPTTQRTPSRAITLREAIHPVAGNTPSHTPAPSISLDAMLSPVNTTKATAFFAEHLQIEAGLMQARAHKPSTMDAKHHTSQPKGVKPSNDACNKLITKWTTKSTPSRTEATTHSALIEYNRKYRGITSAKSEPMNGKSTTYTGFVHLYKAFRDTVTSPVEDPPTWKRSIPTRASLHSKKRFGRPSKDHSNTQEAAFETCLFPILTSGFLDFYSFCRLCTTHVLVLHLVTMIIKCHSYDFTWIAYEDPFWKRQTSVPQSHAFAMLSALFHYRMHPPCDQTWSNWQFKYIAGFLSI